LIFYFSATGNSKYVAMKIAEGTDDKISAITDCTKDTEVNITLSEGETLGIISPTYFWELPINVREFMKKLHITTKGKPYIFFIGTYGTTPGAIGADATSYMKQKGYGFDALYGVQMPDTWTPVFDLSNKEKVAKQNEKAENQIESIMSQIKQKRTGNHMKRRAPYAMRFIIDYAYENKRKTSNFTVENTCVSCGLCEKKCPVNAIEMKNGKPVWKTEQCALCLGCLHRCPKFSIQYGKKTKKHGQYQHPQAKV
jgi:NAD-dependent dihydropyrimidine dehydrogenase PreA subunit/flavodoxin